jgi:polysaccharide chain length determinant protein (PEP-CTERM system associated)
MTTDFDSPRSARELVEYAEVPLRYPFHAFVPFALVLTVAVVLLLVLPKKFQSSTLIMVEARRVSNAADTDRLVERLDTIRQEIQSRTRLERIIVELDPYARYRRPLHWQVTEMRRATHIRVQGNDSFTISFVHRNPEIAMKVTNRLASLFIENTGRIREQAIRDAKGFTQSSLDEARQMLDQADVQVRLFKEKHLGALPEQLEANLATLARLQLERQTVEASLQAAENRREFTLNSIANRGTPTRVSEQAKELLVVRANLAKLRQRYTDQHPDVRQLLARVETLEAQIVETAAKAAKPRAPENASESTESENWADPKGPVGPLKNADFSDPATVALYATVEETTRELARLQQSRQDLAERIAKFQERVELTPKIEAQLYTLQRDYQLRRENYDRMLQKNLDAEMAQRLEQHFQGELFRILDPAHVPQKPISPKPLLFLLAGVFFGVVAGIAAAGLADFLDNRVKTVTQLESIVPAPVLVTTPWVGRLKRASQVRV